MKEIKNYSNYKITRDGKVFSIKRNKFLDGMRDEYLRVSLKGDDGSYKTFRVHRLVAEAFIPNTENKPQVNHINGIKTDNQVENLEWVTQQENMRHAHEMGLFKNRKLNKEQVFSIRNEYKAEGVTQKQLAEKYLVNQTIISRIINKKNYFNI